MKIVSPLALISLTLFSISAPAASVYIGDSYLSGLNITAGNAGDSSAASYIMVESPVGEGLSGDSYYSSVPQWLTFTEVNFYAQVATVGTVTPFLAIYSGSQTSSSVQSGANYNVILVGDAVATSAVGLHNASFTVGGLNPTIQLTLNPGQTLVVGFTTSVAGGLVANTNTATATPDYIRLGTTPPGLGAPLNATVTLNRIEKFNVGFDVSPVPEPSVWALMGLGAGFAVIFRRRARGHSPVLGSR